MEGLFQGRLIIWKAPHLPITAVTANAMEDERQACLKAGIDGFISKPDAIDDLKKSTGGMAAQEHVMVKKDCSLSRVVYRYNRENG